MSTPEHREVAKLLLQKAREDLSAAQALVATEDQADHVIGFHLQQAVEKSLKAVLAEQMTEIPRTTTSAISLSSSKILEPKYLN